MKKVLYVILPVIMYTGCNKVSFRDLEPVVENNLETFERSEVPAGLLPVADNNRILMLGETHYVQEHQEWGTLLLGELVDQGYRLFITESTHAFGWMADDYVTGKRDNIPGYVRYFDHEWLEGIREINTGLAENNQIRVHFMDLNHSPVHFRNSLSEMEKIIGEQPVFQKLQSDPLDSESYKTSLTTLQNKLNDPDNDFRSQWSDVWLERVIEMTEIELISLESRRAFSELRREEAMIGIIMDRLEEFLHQKVVINTGMFHAQKTTLMGIDIPRIAQFLEQDYPEKVFSIAFVGLKGISKYNFYDESPVSVDLLEDTGKRDLIHIIGEKANGNLSYLPLSDGIFLDEMKVTYSKSGTKKLAPARQFDAIITYPQISLLESMNRYSYP